MSATIVIIMAAFCCLLVIGGTIGLYFSKKLCPDFGSKCTSSPAPAPKSPGPAPKSPGPATVTSGGVTGTGTYAGFVPGASGGGIVGIGTGTGTGTGTSAGPCASAGTACRPTPNDVCAQGFTPIRDGNNNGISGAAAINPGMCSACCSGSGDGINFTGRSPYNDPYSGNPYYCTYQHCRA